MDLFRQKKDLLAESRARPGVFSEITIYYSRSREKKQWRRLFPGQKNTVDGRAIHGAEDEMGKRGLTPAPAGGCARPGPPLC
ncbi:MAG: hypothetical protein V8S34_06785, partial [Lawsonibacter sp.]